MAFSTPGTPKNQFITPKKPARNCLLDSLTPRNQTKTPRATSIGTPECFNTVTLETPNSAVKRRGSKENFDRISNLTVAVRIRPMNSKELACVGATNVVTVHNKDITIRSSSTGNSAMSLDHIFQYDHVFWSCDESSLEYSSQEDVFLAIGRPLLNNAFRGYNACLFAYGQTGSGKSFSMMGKNNCDIIDIDSKQFSGVTPRFCRDLFDRIANLDSDSTATVEVSYFEIYNEKIHDLLSTEVMAKKMPLKVREHPEWGPYVVDLSVHTVKSYNELRDWLVLGNKNRATAATNMNEKSSRSHSIFSMELCLSGGCNVSNNTSNTTENSRRSKVSLVDLAGSERIGGGAYQDEEKIRQGVSINKSLLTLGKVISALAVDQKKNNFVPYRDSVLTWLLRESLGGNSLTSMLATITPANSHLDETLATLRYACQARSIVNRARINENPHDRLIRELKQEVERLKALKQDYERNSIISNNSSSSLIQLNDSDNHNKEEMDLLRTKLLEAEKQLLTAEENWKQRFMETTETQMKELVESEKRREELESKFRVMKTIDKNVTLSPYKSNFLEQLTNVLTHEKQLILKNSNYNCNDNEYENIVEWCCLNGFNCTFSNSVITITDNVNKRQTFLLMSELGKMKSYENIADFIASLSWHSSEKSSNKKLSKSEVITNFNKIYECLANLQPADNDNNLNLLFAKVNKSMQSFEAAFLNKFTKVTCSPQKKTVTFDF